MLASTTLRQYLVMLMNDDITKMTEFQMKHSILADAI